MTSIGELLSEEQQRKMKRAFNMHVPNHNIGGMVKGIETKEGEKVAAPGSKKAGQKSRPVQRDMEEK